MPEDFDFPEVDHLTVGAVGPPGQRTFFLQAGFGPRLATLLLEKVQARTLAERVLGVLPEVEIEEVSSEVDLREPLEPAWRIGEIVVGVDTEQGKVALVAREQVGEDEVAGAIARIFATIDQARRFARHTIEVCDAGRPSCPVCALPMEPDGHICPRLNGHRT